MAYTPGQIAVGLGVLAAIVLGAWFVHYKYFYRTCSADADCPTNWQYPGSWMCVDGKCRSLIVKVPCKADADCSSGQKCTNGACA